MIKQLEILQNTVTLENRLGFGFFVINKQFPLKNY